MKGVDIESNFHIGSDLCDFSIFRVMHKNYIRFAGILLANSWHV